MLRDGWNSYLAAVEQNAPQQSEYRPSEVTGFQPIDPYPVTPVERQSLPPPSGDDINNAFRDAWREHNPGPYIADSRVVGESIAAQSAPIAEPVSAAAVEPEPLAAENPPQETPSLPEARVPPPPACSGPSVVDCLNAYGVDSSVSARARVARELGFAMSGRAGSADWNTLFLQELRRVGGLPRSYISR